MAQPTASKIMTGARALIYVGGKQIGFFSSVDWSYSVDVQPAYVLGRFSVAEITYVDAGPVTVRCAGFRAFDGTEANGPHQTLTGATQLVPTLNKLLSAPSVDIEIVDRQTGKSVMKVINAKATNYSTSLRARDQETISVDFMGMRVTTGAENDENEAGNEGGNAANPFLA
jgi:hypothetical protein